MIDNFLYIQRKNISLALCYAYDCTNFAESSTLYDKNGNFHIILAIFSTMVASCFYSYLYSSKILCYKNSGCVVMMREWL